MHGNNSIFLLSKHNRHTSVNLLCLGVNDTGLPESIKGGKQRQLQVKKNLPTVTDQILLISQSWPKEF